MFIVGRQVRWIEAVFACPINTCMASYNIEGPRGHLMKETLGQQERTSGVRGNVYSFGMAWDDIMDQLNDFVPDAALENWPHPPAMVCQIVRVIFEERYGGHSQYSDGLESAPRRRARPRSSGH